MKMQLSSILALAFTVVACSKKDSEGAVTTGAFLKPADFSNLSYDQISGATALSELKDANQIYDNEPTTTPVGDNDSPNSDPAMATCMKNNQPKVNVIEKSTMSVDANIDILQCLASQSGGSTASTAGGKFNLRFLFNISCPGADFSDLQGKTLDEIGASGENPLSVSIEAKCKDLESMKSFANALFELKGGSGSQTVEMTMKAASFSKDGNACTHTKVAAGYQTDGCVNVSYASSSFGSQSKKELSIFESSNLINSVSPTATWFAGGSFKVTLNNFTGTLTYTGVDAAPSYSLTSGSETIKGVLNQTTLTTESFAQLSAEAKVTQRWNQLTDRVKTAWASLR